MKVVEGYQRLQWCMTLAAIMMQTDSDLNFYKHVS